MLVALAGAVAYFRLQPALQPEVPPELRFLYRYDAKPEVKDFHTRRYGRRLKLDSAVPALIFRVPSRHRELVHELKALKGWDVTLAQVGSLHTECRNGPLQLQFYANYGPSSFAVLQDRRIEQPAWRLWLYDFTHRFGR